MRKGSDRFPEDVLWEEVGHYGEWLIRTGLTPEQVDELPIWFADRMPTYWTIRAQARQELG